MISTNQEVLLALLMDRFVPLQDENFALNTRAELIQKLLDSLNKLPAAKPESCNEEKIVKLTGPIVTAYNQLKNNANTNIESLCEQALQALMEGVELGKGDQKKWPSLNFEQKSIRVLTNYYYEQPERYPLEKPYRELGTLSHLLKAKKYIDKFENLSAEKELGYAQEEIRHVLALALGLNLMEIREEAETLSQTSGRSEHDVTLQIFSEKIESSLKTSKELSTHISSFCEEDLEGFVRPLPRDNFNKKVVRSIKSETNLIRILREQYQNLELYLDASAKIDWRIFFEKLLYLPNPEKHHYFRMPDVDHISNVKIFDSQGNLKVHFDEESRLAFAPSVNEMKHNIADENSCVLDVAIIGGGPGGIAAGVNLTALGVFRYAIFERGEANSTVRDIWSREKEADTFYSGPPGPIAGLVGMQDTTRAVFLNRMNSFLDYFHVNLRRKEPVLNVTQENSLWVIQTNQAKYLAKKVIMTAGRYGKPKLLKWEEGNNDAELKSKIVRGVEVDDIENSSVLVIGGGNTAFDNVKTLCANGSGKKHNKVYLSYPKKPFNVPGSLHAHNNDQLLQWEAENKISILWNTNSESCEKISENGKTRFKIGFRAGETPEHVIVDYIAPAVGWMVDRELMGKVGLAFAEENKNPIIDPNTQAAFKMENGTQVALEGLYIAGDYAEQKSVPLAFSSNYRAAKDISKKL